MDKRLMDIPDAKTQFIPQLSNAFKAFIFLSILTLNLILMSNIASLKLDSSLNPILAFGAIFILATINAIVILGMAVLAHEAVHNVLFRSRAINDIAGGVLSAISLIPFYANRQFHLSHHSYAHQEGLDPECDMHGRGFIFAFVVGPHVGIFLQHRKFIANLLRGFKQVKYLRRFFFDLSFLNVAIIYYGSLVIFAGISPLYALLPSALMFTLVFSFRALSDHYGLPAVTRKSKIRKEIGDQDELEREGFEKNKASGWVIISNPVMRWLWSNVNYHEVHHKYPYLSHIHLQRVFELTRNEYEYAVESSYLKNLFNLRKCKYFEAAATQENTLNIDVQPSRANL